MLLVASLHAEEIDCDTRCLCFRGYVCGSCAEISKIVAQGIRMGMEAQRGAGEVRHEQEK